MADVGLIGFPNVGKSTLISVVSEAKPTIANYHFTTLTPVLGVVRMGEGSSFVMADIPGLIEGAGEGVGLGHEFLRHVDRCRLLVHVIDASGSEGRNPIDDFEIINRELSVFDEDLRDRPQIIALNKCDMCEDEDLEALKEHFRDLGYDVFPIMAAISEGVKPLINCVAAKLATLPPIKKYETEELPQEDFCDRDSHSFEIKKENERFVIEAPWLLKILQSVDPDDYESLQYFQRVLQSSGIIEKLEEMGVEEGDTVCVYDIEFDYVK